MKRRSCVCRAGVGRDDAGKEYDDDEFVLKL